MAGPRPPRLGYLALEAPREGQAAHAHVREVIAGLEALGWEVAPFLAARTGAAGGRGPAARLADYALVQARAVTALPRLDALYVRGHPAALPAALAARAAGVPVAQEVNGMPGDIGVTYPWARPLAGALARAQRAQLRGAAAVFAVTPGLVAWARGQAGGDPARVHLVPNGANGALFSPEGPARDHPRPYALFVGGLVRWHGVATMLAARAHPAWPAGLDLVIAGDGVERARVAAAGAGVAWLGRVPYAEVPALLRGALCALSPIEDPGGRSSAGVLPLKLYEAMACGAPVVASDLPGQGDLVRAEGCGLLVPPGDAAALAAAVARLAADPAGARAMGAAGRAALVARHDWRHRAAAIDAALRPLLRRPAARALPAAGA